MKKQQNSPFFSAIVGAPFGAVGIRCEAGAVSELVYLPPGLADQYAARLAPLAAIDSIAQLAADQVARYLRDPDFVFDLPRAPDGSAFQQRVWQAIAAIGRGQVRTYGQVARQIGSAARARAGLRRQPLAAADPLSPGHGGGCRGRLCPSCRCGRLPRRREALVAGPRRRGIVS